MNKNMLNFAIWKVSLVSSVFVVITAYNIFDDIILSAEPQQTISHKKHIKYGVDVREINRNYDGVNIDVDGAAQAELSATFSFPPKNDFFKSGIKITEIKVDIDMQEADATYDANIIKGGIGEDHVDIKVKAENVKRLYYQITVSYVYNREVAELANFLPKKQIDYGKLNAVERNSTTLMQEIKYALVNFEEKEFIHSFPVHVISIQDGNTSNTSNPSSRINIKKIAVLFYVKDADAVYDANIIAGGIGYDHVDLKIKTKNANDLKYQISIYYCTS